MFSRLKSLFATSPSASADKIARKKHGDEHLRGDRFAEATECYRQALSMDPNYVDACIALGFALGEQRQYDEAGKHLRHALSIDPQDADAHYILGKVSRNTNDDAGAIEHFSRALAAKPDFEFAHRDLIAVLFNSGRLHEARDALQKAIAAYPESGEFQFYLGEVFRQEGDYDNAIACYERVLRVEPENTVKHLIAALSGHDSERAPSDFVEALFDDYADRFDNHLVKVLSYSPEKLANLLRPYSDLASPKWTILDLGCGTGLSGVVLAPHARQLVGVDLSARMLEKARARDLYDRLEQLDLLTMMQGEETASFDVLFAADVFVYLGKLDELVEQARRLLRPSGLFAFSVESLDALAGDAAALPERRDYKLNVTARYAHSMAYLTRMAEDYGFDVLCTTGTQHRLDKGKPVEGYLALWRRSPA